MFRTIFQSHRFLPLLFVILSASLTALAVEPKKAPLTPHLSPLLVNKEGHPITTKKAWLEQRENIRSNWLAALGTDLPTKSIPLKTEFLEKEDLPAFTRQHVRYQIEERVSRDGYLLTPKQMKGKAPAIVVFHPTTYLQAKGVAGLAAEYADEKRQGIQLVERGFIVWCPRNFIFDEVPDVKDGIQLYTANVEKLHKKHPQRTGMGQMVLDAIRAADFVESLPNVAKDRIGAIGHSLGGKQVLYAAAFDDRYKAVVSSEGGIGLSFSNWEAVWYLGPQIKRPEWNLENHQVLALVAPRAFFLLAGNSADDDRSSNFIEAVRPVYKLFKAEDRVTWLNHHLGHRYAPEAREAAEGFLDKNLK